MAAHKYITTYWIDGKPSNGMGKNKGRKTALGYFVGKQCVMSMPARLNNHDMPSIKEVAAILRGDSVAAAMTEFNRAALRTIAGMMNADCLGWAACPGGDDFVMVAFNDGIYLVASDLDGGTLEEATKHERIADSWKSAPRVAPVTACPACVHAADGHVLELCDKCEQDAPQFENFYTCPQCDHEWSDVWTAQSDDDCPACGARHISPNRSEDV